MSESGIVTVPTRRCFLQVGKVEPSRRAKSWRTIKVLEVTILSKQTLKSELALWCHVGKSGPISSSCVAGCNWVKQCRCGGGRSRAMQRHVAGARACQPSVAARLSGSLLNLDAALPHPCKGGREGDRSGPCSLRVYASARARERERDRERALKPGVCVRVCVREKERERPYHRSSCGCCFS
ncbi:hypothetical protein L7F22_060087 [Adiantum nelumboides]|nr:hypothetical protein [Adiantum nelumboides]